MAISSNVSYAKEPSTTSHNTSANSRYVNACATNMAPSKISSDSTASSKTHVDNTADFQGEVNTNNNLPSQADLKRIENFNILDQDGKPVPFKNLYSGPNVAKRVLIIFIRHFFCGNCQEFTRTLTASIPPSTLHSLPVPTFIAIIGCGSPSLIPMYQAETNCPFPIYTDPTKKLYDELGMMRTLNLGQRPEYQRKELWTIMMASFVQSLKMMKGGMALKGGDMQQVGGEFLFEPVEEVESPSPSPMNSEKQLGNGYAEVEKRVTWCHRMRNTRDHAEIPEIREVLGLEPLDGGDAPDQERWTKALLERKGTGLTIVGRSGSSLSKKLAGLENEGQSSDAYTRPTRVMR